MYSVKVFLKVAAFFACADAKRVHSTLASTASAATAFAVLFATAVSAAAFFRRSCSCIRCQFFRHSCIRFFRQNCMGRFGQGRFRNTQKRPATKMRPSPSASPRVKLLFSFSFILLLIYMIGVHTCAASPCAVNYTETVGWYS